MKTADLQRMLAGAAPETEVVWEWKGGLLAPDLYPVEGISLREGRLVLHLGTAPTGGPDGAGGVPHRTCTPLEKP